MQLPRWKATCPAGIPDDLPLLGSREVVGIAAFAVSRIGALQDVIDSRRGFSAPDFPKDAVRTGQNFFPRLACFRLHLA